MPSNQTGSSLLCSTLEQLGVRHLFGIPGSQDVELYETLRRSSIRTILTTHELAASFMAIGYFRRSGKVGVVVTSRGPGFTYALPGVAEAFLDSAALLWIVNIPTATPGHQFQLQDIDHRTMAGPIVKRRFSIETFSDLRSMLVKAYQTALQGEPGPVLVEIANSALLESGSAPDLAAPSLDRLNPEIDPAFVPELIQAIHASQRPAFYVGAGANAASQVLRELAEILNAPVFTTTAGRGVLPENHPLVFSFDSGLGGVSARNAFFQSCDLILALGCKFSHNGAHGFRLQLPADKLIHIDASADVLGANYPAWLSFVADVPALLAAIRQQADLFRGRTSAWSQDELKQWRERIRAEQIEPRPEPAVRDLQPPTAAAFFAALREALPPRSCLVTDSGMHQMLARKYFSVLSPRSFVLPTDFQSMGFGLPAAIGAKLASPDQPVIALMGDGGFALSGMEILTAVREQIPLTVILFNDGKLGLIRRSQLESFGRAHATDLKNPDFSLLARAVGARYSKMAADVGGVIRQCLDAPGVTLLEVGLEDSLEFHKMHAADRKSVV